MEGLANILVGLAALAALAIAVLAHDWRDEFRGRMLHRRSHAGYGSLREWWLRHRH
ncbi:hypothetical protein LJR029_000136 [Caballeronia sp. LjRoot29]|uniref:hypothetical protein n=1 Tax=Caballeronia sp. LjRoot29 TaxID=3342315 RepID=UPI003ED0A3EE